MVVVSAVDTSKGGISPLPGGGANPIDMPGGGFSAIAFMSSINFVSAVLTAVAELGLSVLMAPEIVMSLLRSMPIPAAEIVG